MIIDFLVSGCDLLDVVSAVVCPCGTSVAPAWHHSSAGLSRVSTSTSTSPASTFFISLNAGPFPRARHSFVLPDITPHRCCRCRQQSPLSPFANSTTSQDYADLVVCGYNLLFACHLREVWWLLPSNASQPTRSLVAFTYERQPAKRPRLLKRPE